MTVWPGRWVLVIEENILPPSQLEKLAGYIEVGAEEMGHTR
jgi:hypothetical protein